MDREAVLTYEARTEHKKNPVSAARQDDKILRLSGFARHILITFYPTSVCNSISYERSLLTG